MVTVLFSRAKFVIQGRTGKLHAIFNHVLVLVTNFVPFARAWLKWLKHARPTPGSTHTLIVSDTVHRQTVNSLVQYIHEHDPVERERSVAIELPGPQPYDGPVAVKKDFRLLAEQRAAELNRWKTTAEQTAILLAEEKERADRITTELVKTRELADSRYGQLYQIVELFRKGHVLRDGTRCTDHIDPEHALALVHALFEERRRRIPVALVRRTIEGVGTDHDHILRAGYELTEEAAAEAGG